jgi:hypothetical protein
MEADNSFNFLLAVQWMLSLPSPPLSATLKDLLGNIETQLVSECFKLVAGTSLQRGSGGGGGRAATYSKIK